MAARTDDLRRLAADLIAVPSVGGSPAEAAVQLLLAERLRGWGLDVAVHEWAVDDVGGQPGFPGMEVPRERLVGVTAAVRGVGGGPALALVGHSDVVPAQSPGWTPEGPFQADFRSSPGRLVGRGSADMKAGLAAACVAAAAIADTGLRLPGDVLVASVSAEEDGGAGAFALLSSGFTAHAAIIPEPTDLRVVHATAGSLTFRIRLPGTAAHGALRWMGDNPLNRLGAVVQALHELEAVRCAHPDPAMADWPIPYPISIGRVHGGTWASTVPDEIVVEGRYGVALGEPIDQAKAQFEHAVARACAADPGLRRRPAEVSWWGGEFASARTCGEHPVVANLLAADGAVRGRPAPAPQGVPYGTDMRLLAAAGIPTVVYGPGRAPDAHSVPESVCWADVVTAAQVLAQTAVRFCSDPMPAVDGS